MDAFASFCAHVAARPDELFARNEGLATKIKGHLKAVTDQGSCWYRDALLRWQNWGAAHTLC
jgi:hypothetical protein